MKQMGVKLLGFFCLALLIGVVITGPAAAAEPGVEESPLTTSNEGASSAAESVVINPMSEAQCNQGTMCIWQANNFEGNFSWWFGQSTGCVDHNANPEIRSLWNRTGFSAELEGYAHNPIPSGGKITGAGVYTGYLCW
jgi:hypothetical protein